MTQLYHTMQSPSSFIIGSLQSSSSLMSTYFLQTLQSSCKALKISTKPVIVFLSSNFIFFQVMQKFFHLNNFKNAIRMNFIFPFYNRSNVSFLESSYLYKSHALPCHVCFPQKLSYQLFCDSQVASAFSLEASCIQLISFSSSGQAAAFSLGATGRQMPQSQIRQSILKMEIIAYGIAFPASSTVSRNDDRKVSQYLLLLMATPYKKQLSRQDRMQSSLAGDFT